MTKEEIERKRKEFIMSDAEWEAVTPLFVAFQNRLQEKFGKRRTLPIMANLVGSWLSHTLANSEDEGGSVFALHITHEQHDGPPADLILHGYSGYSEFYAEKDKVQ